MRHLTAIIALAALLAAGLSCLPNPEGPTLDPPGSELLYFANYNSIQMNGDFSGVSWVPADPRNNLTLVADNTWEITFSLLDTDVSSDGRIVFKFSHDGSWSNQNFGAGGSLGQAEMAADPADISLPLVGGNGFYTMQFNDETLRYSAEPPAATGTLTGTVAYDGDPPAEPATVELTVEGTHGNVELWSVDATGGAFAFAALADSVYRLRVTASGYATDNTATGIRVENGAAPVQAILLTQVFGAISGTVTFSDAPAVLPEAIVVAYEHGTDTEAGRDSTDAAGDYLVEGLSTGAFDLRFSAPGYTSTALDNVYVDGDVEVAGVDVTMDPIPAATPDQPWHTRTIDGALDAGWVADLTDPAGDSGWGPSNDFHGLHVDWDADRLYVAVSGSYDGSSNTVNVYVDQDYGAGTGTTDFSGISDGSVGDHLRKTIDMSAVTGYGADFAGSVWATQYDPEVTDISVPASIDTIAGQVLAASAGCVEFSVPWTSLYPDLEGGVPPLVELAFYCVIGGGGDEFLADDTLPPVGNAQAPDAVFVIQVDADER